jgi:MoaA/NifB/PqqE/SkfB family radical SAM enzyme
MNLQHYVREFAPKILNYKLARAGLVRPARPITLTYSVTNRCQSRCLTCKIWRVYKDHPARVEQELTLDEIERAFKSIGHIYFFNISGGEPFLRDDLADIVGLALEHLTPRIVHIPTNALMPQRIRDTVEEILRRMESRAPETPLTVKPSLDAVGEKHDEIRGVPGNFDKVLQTIDLLKELGEKYPALHVEAGTVISRYNIDEVEKLTRFVSGLGIESYRHEIAEERAEFRNREDGIAPSPDEYERLAELFARSIRGGVKDKRRLTRLTESFRLVYYELAARIVREGRQVVPCYAGISNAHMDPYGEVWACCVLGYDKPLGDLRAVDLDFGRVWHSEQADEVRRFIRSRGCACPLANQAYSNILLSISRSAKVFRRLVTG